MWVHTVNMWVGPRGIILKWLFWGIWWCSLWLIAVLISGIFFFCADTIMCGNRGWLHLLPVVVSVVPRLFQACIINKAKCQGDNARPQLHLWRPVMVLQRENKMLRCRRRDSDRPVLITKCSNFKGNDAPLSCDCKCVSVVSSGFHTGFHYSDDIKHVMGTPISKNSLPSLCFLFQTGWCNHHQKSQAISILSQGTKRPNLDTLDLLIRQCKSKTGR